MTTYEITAEQAEAKASCHVNDHGDIIENRSSIVLVLQVSQL